MLLRPEALEKVRVGRLFKPSDQHRAWLSLLIA
jgi:hypothetical protein